MNETLLALLKAKAIPAEIIEAFAKIKRELFVPEHLVPYAYEDTALPIQHGTTLAQPSTIATMLKLLEANNAQKILEIGTGSGYVLALLHQLNSQATLYGLEINQKLAVEAKNRLSDKENVHVLATSGTHGLLTQAPFDRILVSAAAPDKSILLNLLSQLTDQGILVGPVNDTLLQIKKAGIEHTVIAFPGFTFVPLLTE